VSPPSTPHPAPDASHRALGDLADPEYLDALGAALGELGEGGGPAAPSPTVPPGVAAYGTDDPLSGLLADDLPLEPRADHHRLTRYLRREILPTTFCVGCGGGIVLNAFTHAVDELGLDPRGIVCVTGIGCSSWIPSPYFLCDTLHTTHGRAVAFACGVKVMRPDMKVIVIAGDGDLAGIGGNHLIHAARRNIDLTVFLVNNFIYGMTGGQVSPTTPFGVRTTTTPYRNVEHPFRIADLVAAAGGTYVARWTTYHAFQLMEAMQHAIQKPGFSFIEIMSQCPISYGKMAGMADAVTILEYLRDASIPVEEARSMSEEQLAERMVVGKLVERQRPELTACLAELNREREAAILAELGGDGDGGNSANGGNGENGENGGNGENGENGGNGGNGENGGERGDGDAAGEAP
jgi:2-oxoglutarate ferredoxin oxidoreductase subunit beta